jgi:hypothetical protein
MKKEIDFLKEQITKHQLDNNSRHRDPMSIRDTI